MLLIPGILASKFVPQGDFESIATVTLSSGQNEIEFTSIPNTYQHLQIRSISNSNFGSVNNLYMRFNGDTATNYNWHALNGNGSTAGSTAGTSQGSILINRIQGTGTNFSGFVLDILDYKDTNKFTTIRSLSGFDANGSGEVWFWSGAWRDTNAITSLKISAQFGGATTINTNSHFALYGIKG
jgi:hypothetical protein